MMHKCAKNDTCQTVNKILKSEIHLDRENKLFVTHLSCILGCLVENILMRCWTERDRRLFGSLESF